MTMDARSDYSCGSSSCNTAEEISKRRINRLAPDEIRSFIATVVDLLVEGKSVDQLSLLLEGRKIWATGRNGRMCCGSYGTGRARVTWRGMRRRPRGLL